MPPEVFCSHYFVQHTTNAFFCTIRPFQTPPHRVGGGEGRGGQTRHFIGHENFDKMRTYFLIDYEISQKVFVMRYREAGVTGVREEIANSEPFAVLKITNLTKNI